MTGRVVCELCGEQYARTLWHHLETCSAYSPRPLNEIAADLDELGFPMVAGPAFELVREAAVVMHRLARKDPRALELAAAAARKRERSLA